MSLGTMGSSSILSCQTDTPQDIYPTTDRLKVGWIHASTIPAKMVKGKPFRDGADKQLVGKTVGSKPLAIHS